MSTAGGTSINVGEDEKRLLLVLDLDHTLLHTILVSHLPPQETYLLRPRPQASPPESPPAGDLFCTNMGDQLITKLRPGVRDFLLEAGKMYRLSICTMGNRTYAQGMTKLLDPEGIYFLPGDVVSREDFPEAGKKSLAVVPRADERTAVVLDDTAEVWGRHLRNLVPIPPYHYFRDKKSIGRSTICGERKYSLAESRRDESAGVLADTLRLLTRVHRMYFFPGAGGDIRSPLPLPPPSSSSPSPSGDVRRILRELKSEMPVAAPRRIIPPPARPPNPAAAAH